MSRFQDSSNAFDDVAAEILALDRRDLSCMTMLLFAGAASAEDLAGALHMQRGIVTTTLERLQLAGYARFEPGNGTRIELTEHARKWIERIWAPVREDGNRLLEVYPVQQLAIFDRFLQQVCEVLESQTRQLRTWLRGSVVSGQAVASSWGALACRASSRAVVCRGESRTSHSSPRPGRARRAEPLSFRARVQDFGRHDAANVRRTSPNRTGEAVAHAESTQSLAQVAMEVGFGTQSRLSSIFKRRTGFTPGEYRREREVAGTGSLS